MNLTYRPRTASRIATTSLVALSLILGGCDFGLGKLVDFGNSAILDGSDKIDVAISQLQITSASWQQTLTTLEQQLKGDAKELIGNDIQNLITRTVNHAGVEFRCDGDFINQRIIEALIGIKAKLLGKPIPALEPRFCSAIPEAVDMKLVPQSVNKVTFYGYNFDNNSGFKLKLEDLSGSGRDVSQAISIPTAYAMTLALGPSGVTLSGSSARLLLYWGDKLVSTISVIQPQPVVKVCKSSVAPAAVQYVGPLIPPLVHGDGEFDGNGPKIRANASLTNTPTDVTLHLYFRARETESDWTEVAGSLHTVVYRAPAGMRIDKIASSTSSFFGPVTQGDEHWPRKAFELGDGGLLKRVQITGDLDGDDAGRTGLYRAVLNPMQIVLSETGDCVSPNALNSLIGTRFLSAEVKRAVASRVIAERNRIRELTRFRPQ